METSAGQGEDESHPQRRFKGADTAHGGAGTRILEPMKDPLDGQDGIFLGVYKRFFSATDEK
jgi:hypothetical protein